MWPGAQWFGSWATWSTLESKGMTPLGMEPIRWVSPGRRPHHHAVQGGPHAAIRRRSKRAHASPEKIGSWDLHATATPGDYPGGAEPARRAARDGDCDSAQGHLRPWHERRRRLGADRAYLGYAGGHLFPTVLPKSSNEAIAGIHGQFVFADSCVAAEGFAGKLSSGIGGINACVISRPLQHKRE